MSVYNFKIEVEKFILHSQSVRYSAIGGRARSFTTKEYKAYKEELREQMPELLLEGNLDVEITFKYPPLKSFKKDKLELLKEKDIDKQTLPDVDNMAKSVLDSMSKTLIVDDALVSSLSLKKVYSNVERKTIEIKVVVKDG